MQQNVDPAPKHDQWRVHPIWQSMGVIFTATGIVDLVIGYYPNPRTPITIVSILGGVVCIVVLLWNPLFAAAHSGYTGFRSILSTYFTRKSSRLLVISVLVGLALLSLLVVLLLRFFPGTTILSILVSLAGVFSTASPLITGLRKRDEINPAITLRYEDKTVVIFGDNVDKMTGDELARFIAMTRERPASANVSATIRKRPTKK